MQKNHDFVIERLRVQNFQNAMQWILLLNISFNSNIHHIAPNSGEIPTRFRTHAGDVVLVADAFLQEPVSDLPGEDRRALPLIIGDAVHNIRRGNSGLTATDSFRPDRAGLVVTA